MSAARYWTFNRKAEVTKAILDGDLTREAACLAYGLSREELDGWVERFKRWGVHGLKVTCLQDLRFVEAHRRRRA